MRLRVCFQGTHRSEEKLHPSHKWPLSIHQHLYKSAKSHLPFVSQLSFLGPCGSLTFCSGFSDLRQIRLSIDFHSWQRPNPHHITRFQTVLILFVRQLDSSKYLSSNGRLFRPSLFYNVTIDIFCHDFFISSQHPSVLRIISPLYRLLPVAVSALRACVLVACSAPHEVFPSELGSPFDWGSCERVMPS